MLSSCCSWALLSSTACSWSAAGCDAAFDVSWMILRVYLVRRLLVRQSWSMPRAAMRLVSWFCSRRRQRTIGTVGQGNYAAANAHLDTVAISCRSHGLCAASLQLPMITGAGMGEATLSGSVRSQGERLEGVVGGLGGVRCCSGPCVLGS